MHHDNDTQAEPLFLASDLARLRQRAERTSNLVGDLLNEANALGWEGRRAEAAVYLRRAEGVLGVLEAVQQYQDPLSVPQARTSGTTRTARTEQDVRADLAGLELELTRLFARQRDLVRELHQVRAMGRSVAAWRQLVDRATQHDEALWNQQARNPAERRWLDRAREISSARVQRWEERLGSAEWLGGVA